jgi:hypothetical protein
VRTVESGNDIAGKWDGQIVRLAGISHVESTAYSNGVARETFCTHLFAALPFERCELRP